MSVESARGPRRHQIAVRLQGRGPKARATKRAGEARDL